MERYLDNLQSADGDIEAQLLAAPLVRPSAMLDARVSQTIGKRKTRIRQRKMAGAIAAVLIAGLLCTFATNLIPTGGNRTIGTSEQPRPAPHQITPSSISVEPRRARIVRTLSAVRNDGIIATVDGQPVDCLRQILLDQVVVIDPKSGLTVTYRRPRERLYYVNSKTY